jgi:hypothetical protein
VLIGSSEKGNSRPTGNSLDRVAFTKRHVFLGQFRRLNGTDGARKSNKRRTAQPQGRPTWFKHGQGEVAMEGKLAASLMIKFDWMTMASRSNSILHCYQLLADEKKQSSRI